MAILSDAGLNYFGSFLIEKGIIDENALQDALRFQEDMNFRIGELAIKKGYLQSEQVEQIFAEQKTVDMPFGSLALKHKMLSRQQLDDLLFSQTIHSTHLGEALLVRGHISPGQFDSSLREYNEVFRKRQEMVRATLRDYPDGALIEVVLHALDKTFIRFTRSGVKLRSIGEDINGLQFAFCCTVSLPLLEARTLDAEVYFSEDVAAEMARPEDLRRTGNGTPAPDVFIDFFTIFQRYVISAMRDKMPANAQARLAVKRIEHEGLLSEDGIHLLLITPSGPIMLRVLVLNSDTWPAGGAEQ